MTKTELIKKIATSTGVDASVATTVVESFMKNVKDSMISGDNVYLRGFGTFRIQHRAAKIARNITKNTTILIPPHDIPQFKPSKGFVAALNDEQATDLMRFQV